MVQSNKAFRTQAVILTFLTALSLSVASQAATAVYKVRVDSPRQTMRGLGVEIQSDSIGSDNDGLPEARTSVPHDLVPTERTRLARELVGRGHGFRYIRLAGGLYLRGETADRKNFVARWPTQIDELKSLVKESGAEGIAYEYWSPPSYWKSGNSLIGGHLKSFEPDFLSDFGDSVVRDLEYLTDRDIPVVAFGLQNEAPHVAGKFPHANYDDDGYVKAFNSVAAKVRARYPGLHIHANSWDGQSRKALRDGLRPELFDAWTWHKIGADSDLQIDQASMFLENRMGKEVYNNEYEYLDNKTSEVRMINTAQSIMNWFTFVESPTWYWLHALKPTYNIEAEGYALGYWRPHDDNDFSKFSAIAKGHFDYEPRNWRSLQGFLDWMPWNSVRYVVDEPTVRRDNRILAFRQGGADGKLVIALTNRSTSSFEFAIDAGVRGAFRGYRYSLAEEKKPLGEVRGPALRTKLPARSIEFWVEQ